MKLFQYDQHPNREDSYIVVDKSWRFFIFGKRSAVKVEYSCETRVLETRYFPSVILTLGGYLLFQLSATWAFKDKDIYVSFDVFDKHPWWDSDRR